MRHPHFAYHGRPADKQMGREYGHQLQLAQTKDSHQLRLDYLNHAGHCGHHSDLDRYYRVDGRFSNEIGSVTWSFLPEFLLYDAQYAFATYHQLADYS